MTTLPLIPDAKKIVADYLRTHPAIVALNARVVGEPPSVRTTPWIQTTFGDATDVTHGPVDQLIEHEVQLDCYSGKPPDGPPDSSSGAPFARRLASTARAALVQLIGSQGVTFVTFPVHREVPDTTFDDPGPRARVVLVAKLRIRA